MTRHRGVVALIGVVLAGTTAGCGGDDGAPPTTRAKPSAPPPDARDAGVQRAVARYVKRATHRGVEQATGAYVDPRQGRPTTVECRPRGARELSCVVAGYGLPGFSKFTSAPRHGPFRWRWAVTVDPATGTFRARPTQRLMPTSTE